METNLLESLAIIVNTHTCSKCCPCSRICPNKVFNAKNGDEIVISHTEECVLCIQQNQRK